jgi:hypothetical protein
VFFSSITLIWQLLVLFACCSALGLSLRFLLPREFSLLNKVLFSLLGGLFLVVLIPQNLIYLGVPARISAWPLLAAALVQVCSCWRKIFAWRRAFFSNGDVRTLAVVILLTITFHGIAPIRQGLEWYYGKGHFDQINYALLAEFLKEEPYSLSEQSIGLRPWLVGPIGFQDSTGEHGMGSDPGLETIGLKNERIGQSVITAEISVWSGTDGKGGYAATAIFFLTLLAICAYVFLRETGIDRFLAGSGALLAAFLPAVTRLSLDGFLSQLSILFTFPFFASLLRRRELSARGFTLFFSLTLAYIVAVYSELAPIGLCTFFLGVLWVRDDQARPKRLMLMSALLLIVLVNPFYLSKLIGFLAYQYNLAANAATLWDNSAPDVSTLRGWSELVFGGREVSPFVLFFDYGALLLGLFFLTGVLFLSRRDQLILGTILLPPFFLVLYLSARTPISYYPIAKITLSILPFLIGLVFVALSRVAVHQQGRPTIALIQFLGAGIVAVAATGSARYYSEVLNNEGLLTMIREPRFLDVCRALEETKSKRVLVLETHPLLAAWLCYHARHNDVYFDGRSISDSSLPPGLPFSKIPDLENVDLVATRSRTVDLRAQGLSYLTSVDDVPGEDWTHGQVRYRLGPPARLRFLASRAFSANVQMRLTPALGATTFPIDFFLTDPQGRVFQGELWSPKVEVFSMNLPRGLSYLELSVKPKEIDRNGVASFPIVVDLDDLQISDSDWRPGR